ncbi:MAG: hypothetical protein O9284_12830 [Steroidobacteraceae bacterium]|jgi:hypothetical protein|nr:hypothetical protein [Steroidobacteraceae bacterium]
MLELFKVFWDIALWRRGPRDVPASGVLLALLAVAYATVSALQAWMVDGPEQAWLRAFADLGFTALVFYVVLAIGRRTNRYLQTLCAVLGTSLLLSLPLLALLAVGGTTGGGPVETLLALATLPLLVWYLFVIGHVVRQALDGPLLLGMAVSMTYFLLSYAVLEQFSPAGGGG